MGQAASRRHQHHYKDYKAGGGGDMKRRKKVNKYPLEIWRQIKDIEIVQLKEKAAETEQEFERLKKKMLCQSFLLKEIFEDRFKEQKENHEKEIAELKKEIAELKKVFQKIK